MAKTQRFPIGQKFIDRRRLSAREHTVVDVLRTFNSKDELVSLRYVTTFKLLGQDVTCNDILDITIARCLAREGQPLPAEEVREGPDAKRDAIQSDRT